MSLINKLMYPSTDESVVLLNFVSPLYEHLNSVYQGYFFTKSKKMARKFDDTLIPFAKGLICYSAPIYLGMYELPLSVKLIAGTAVGAANVLINHVAFKFGQNFYSNTNFPKKSKKVFMRYIGKESKESKRSLESHL